MSASIVGLGTWLPSEVRLNEAWPSDFGARAQHTGERTFNDIPPPTDAGAAALIERDLAREASDPFLGAERRHVADASVTAGQAEAWAASAALADAGIDAGEVDLILSYAVVPERVGLMTAGTVAHLVGATRAIGIGIENACASSCVQLAIARAYVEAGLARTVLLTQSHLMLRAFPLMHPAAPGLGDAASAMVVTRGPGLTIRGTFGATHGEYATAVTWVRGVGDQGDAPWWRGGEDFRLGSKAPEQVKLLMRDTVSFASDAIRRAAQSAGIDVERIGALCAVQPRGFIPGAIAEHLGLRRECAVSTYQAVAHVGACGPVFNLLEARRRGMLSTGCVIAAYGQGAGFTRASALLEATK
jgi:3-oxoacyl-[acyl-carrier-protein] synthase III